MKYKVIVSDVDGTLFKSGNAIEDQTARLIEQYQQVGGIFTLATGRMKKAIDPFIQKLKIKVPVIVYNGAQVINPLNNQVIFSCQLTPSFAEKALEIVNEYPVSPIVHIQQQPYVKEHNQDILAHMNKDGIECIITDKLAEHILKSPTKILIIGDPNVLKQVEQSILKENLTGYQAVYSDKNYLELLPEGASKGSALQVLASNLGISLEDIVAVGDERNDISMLMAAGLGVAVANAATEVKSRADLITEGAWNKGLEEVLEAVLKNRM